MSLSLQLKQCKDDYKSTACSLFSDTVSNSDFTATNDWIAVKTEMEKI
jgi:hypothetical protein